MAKKAGLELIISLTDEATSGLQRITGGLKGLAVVGGAAAAAAIVAVGKAAWDAGLLYDDAMDTIITKTGASGDALAGLETDFKRVFTSIPTEAGPAAEVIAELNRRVGLTGPTLQEASKQVLEMSRLLGGDATANAALFGRVMGDWGLTAEDAGLALDKVFVASQKTGVGVDSLMQAVVKFGAPLRNMGFQFDESVALLSSFEKEGVNAELVLGSLRIAAGKFAREGQPLRESLMATFEAIQNNTNASEALALGMEVFGARAGPDMVAAIREGRFSVEELAAAMGTAEGAIMETAAATADFPEKLQVLRNKVTTLLMPLGSLMVSGLTAAVDAISPFIDQAIGWFQNLTLEGSTVSTLWETIRTTAEAVWPKVQAVITTAIGAIQRYWGDILLPTLEMFWTFIQDNIIPLFEVLVTWLATNIPVAIEALSVFWADTLLPAIKTVWEFITTNLIPLLQRLAGAEIDLLKAALQALAGLWETTLKPALETVWSFIQDSVIPTFGTLVAWLGENIPVAIETARAFWEETLKPALEAVWSVIQNNVLPIFGTLVTWLSENIPAAIETARAFWEETLKPALEAVWSFTQTNLIPIFETVATYLGTTLGEVIETARRAWEEVLWPAIKLVWDIIDQKLVPILESVVDWLQTQIPKAIDKAKEVFDALKTKAEEVKSKFDPVLKVLKDIAEWVGEKLKKPINDLKDFLGSLSIPDPFSGILETLNSIISKAGSAISKLREALGLQGSVGGGGKATGTFLAAGGLTLVGEAGPELVRLPMGSRVFSNGESQRLAGGAPLTINFLAPASAYDERRVELAVERALARSGSRADVLRRTR